MTLKVLSTRQQFARARTPGAVTSRVTCPGAGGGRDKRALGRGSRERSPARGPKYPQKAPPRNKQPGKSLAMAPLGPTRSGPRQGGDPLFKLLKPRTATRPRPATSAPLTHRPSSCSASFALKLKPQHPTLPTPPLTHFPAEPAPSITPASRLPPPPPGRARPRSRGGLVGVVGGQGKSCRGRRTAFPAPGAAHCGRCSSASEVRRRRSELIALIFYYEGPPSKARYFRPLRIINCD